MKTNEIYQSVTDTIIQLLETQLEKWDRPWVAFGNADNDYARNAVSGKYYRGLNQFLLSFSLMGMDYPKNTWLTFHQVKEKGGNVRKGEKSTPIVFFKRIFMDKDKKYHSPEKASAYSKSEAEAIGLESVPLLRLYYVFNIAQTEGLAPKFYEVSPAAPLQDFEKDDRAEQLIFATGANIEIVGSQSAYYNLATDKIRLPLREQFKGTEPFYATALHEVAHWTGHESRLKRDMSGSFGDDAYAKEELVAELTAAFCCASLGFSKTISNNAAYIKHWLGILKTDNKAVVRASYQAQKAADFIIGGGKLPSYDND